MTAALRPRVAGACAAAVVLCMFLPWTTEGGETLRGVEVGEGRLILLTGIATVLLIRFGNRASWITAGFAAAVMWRRVLVAPAEVDVGAGPKIGTMAASVAVILLVWNMLAEVRPDNGFDLNEVAIVDRF